MVICGKVQILAFLFLVVFWSFYLFSKLREVDDEMNVFCSKCQIVGSESLRDLGQEGGADDKILVKFEGNLYDTPIDMIDDGFWELSRDQIVVRGLTELSSIQKSEKNIFVVESSCLVGFSSQEEHSEVFGIGTLEACGVESTARANPDRPVYIFHSCPLTDDFALRVPDYARALLDLHNVFVVVLDIAELSKGWPDPLPLSSTSLGLLALWQFGGTYCHLDTLVLRPLRALGTNYCGFREDDLLIADVLLNFEPLGYGHTVVTQVLKHMSKGFQRGVRREVGSFLTTVVDEQCSELPGSEEDCNKLTIYDSTVLFSVQSNIVEIFLSENFASEFVDRIKQTAFAINYFSHLLSFSEDKDGDITSAYTLAKEFCPEVYKHFQHTLMYD